MKPVRPTVSAIVAILGDYLGVYQQVERFVHDTARMNTAHSGSVELILVLSNVVWLRALPFHELEKSGVKVLLVEDDEDLPACFFNRGAAHAQGEFLAFAWPGIEFNSWMDYLVRMSGEVASTPNIILFAGKPDLTNIRSNSLQTWKYLGSDGIPPGYPGGWLEMLDFVPMTGSVVSRRYFIDSGGFSCSPILQRGFWWEFTVRVARSESIQVVETASPEGAWSWYEFPLENDLPLSGDLIARRVVRRSACPPEVMQSCDWNDTDGFLVDLPISTRQRMRKLMYGWAPDKKDVGYRSLDDESSPDALTSTTNPLRVVVLGGLNEPAHNQLCFFNYFALLEGQGILTWRSILDTAAHSVDLVKADLVIFSRVKSEQGCRLMDFCNENQIPTIYMLDDNWFSVSKDWPEYLGVLSPGAPLYENFMYCLKRADQVLTYNKVLAEDLRPHSRHLEILPTNIDLSLFPKIDRQPGHRPRVGYVGSLRKEDSAFIALSELVGERQDFDVFVMSGTVPEALGALPEHRLIYHPYVFGYRRYAQVLCKAVPDILLAPLGSTRTDASKCPNKYLEITAAQAIGIYSDTAPYNQFIRNGKNGVLVQNDVTSWKSAIQMMLDSPASRAEILTNAEQDVRSHFNTTAVLPVFTDFLMRASGVKAKCLEPTL